mgnify:CR=1 FL=1
MQDRNDGQEEEEIAENASFRPDLVNSPLTHPSISTLTGK